MLSNVYIVGFNIVIHIFVEEHCILVSNIAYESNKNINTIVSKALWHKTF